jgi:hypothetical protein
LVAISDPLFVYGEESVFVEKEVLSYVVWRPLRRSDFFLASFKRFVIHYINVLKFYEDSILHEGVPVLVRFAPVVLHSEPVVNQGPINRALADSSELAVKSDRNEG